MPKPAAARERTWAFWSASRMTCLSPELLRAWERRHRVVEPLRTPGGTRRYRASDLERLRLLKAAVDAGHRIGQLAELSNAELEALGREPAAAPRGSPDEIFAALERLDGAEAQRLLALQLAALGGVRFARGLAMPLALEIGERWADHRLGVASEHLASALLRSLLGSALQPGASALRGARIVFATLPGERHELGLLMAALAAMGAGANPIYLGPEVPVEELLRAVERSGAAALALSILAADPREAARALGALRADLAPELPVWIGGAGSAAIATPAGVERIESLEELEQRVALLALERARER
jgi:DNA-binding transcriptional MerR regulator/methylmalonyl-CoA mutase cobalamin-binding subunit